MAKNKTKNVETKKVNYELINWFVLCKCNLEGIHNGGNHNIFNIFN